MPSLTIQLIGFAAIGFILVSFQLNKRSTILIMLLVGQVLFSMHYGLLGAWTAVMTNLLAVVRGYVYYNKNRYTWARSSAWVYVFVGITWVAVIFTWEGWYSLLVVTGMTIETIALWQNNPKYIRISMLVERPLFFTYSLIVGSYAGLAADIIFSISIIIGMFRFDRKSLKD